MHKLKQILFFFTLTVLVASCEKDITVDIPQPLPQVVVEGWISNDEYPTVILTRSSPYFAPVDTSAVINTIIYNAQVMVSNGSLTDTLNLTYDPSYFPQILYRGSKFKGSIGGSYDLRIIADGKTITSTTTIPDTVPLDSIWFKFNGASDSLGFIWANLTDPTSTGQNYRWAAKRVGKDLRYISPLGSVTDDRFFNGQSFEFYYNRGQLYNSDAPDDNNEEIGLFKQGDSVIVRFSTIDYNSFIYFQSYETEAFNDGNPFAAPSNVKTNINGGLGVWCGYGNTYKYQKLKAK